MKKKLKSSKDKEILFILFRYLTLLLIVLISPVLIFFVLKPLTINFTVFILDIIYDIFVNNSLIIIDSKTYISIVSACVAGSAYILLTILNLTTPMKKDVRIKSILLSFILLFVLNILRIITLSVLYHENFKYIEFTHAFFWYGLSTIFVVIIWVLTFKKFKINNIPVYTDLLTISKTSFLENRIKLL